MYQNVPRASAKFSIRGRFKLLIVGFDDSKVKVSMKAFSAVSIVEMNDQLYLHIGLDNGVLLHTIIDNVMGGLDKLKLQKIVLQGESAVL